MIEQVQNPEFWQTVALTAAARLSVVAVVLWAVKMVTDRIAARNAQSTAPPSSPAPQSLTWRQPGTAKTPEGRFVTLVERRRPSPSAKPGDDRTRAAGGWRSRMDDYLAGKPVSASGAPRR